MNLLKNLKFVILIIVILLILVLVRNSNQNLFRNDAENAIEAAQYNQNMISLEQLKKRTSSWIIINLGNEDLPELLHFKNSMHLPFENLLDDTNRKILKEVKGDLILYAPDDATTAKAWVILNQIGFKNIFYPEFRRKF